MPKKGTEALKRICVFEGILTGLQNEAIFKFMLIMYRPKTV
jgi:hypothetical protein